MKDYDFDDSCEVDQEISDRVDRFAAAGHTGISYGENQEEESAFAIGVNHEYVEGEEETPFVEAPPPSSSESTYKFPY